MISEKGNSLQDFTSISENTPSKLNEGKNRELKSTLKKESTTTHKESKRVEDVYQNKISYDDYFLVKNYDANQPSENHSVISSKVTGAFISR